jgi:uncharacterized protein (DUF111 family)
MVSILCERKARESMSTLLYTETSTLGVRVREVERECLEREVIAVQTEFGTIDVKLGKLNGKVVNSMPEYDQVRRAALENKVSFRIVRDAALRGLESSKTRSAPTN